MSCFGITLQQLMPMRRDLAHSVFGRLRTCDIYIVASHLPWGSVVTVAGGLYGLYVYHMCGTSQRPTVPNPGTLQARPLPKIRGTRICPKKGEFLGWCYTEVRACPKCCILGAQDHNKCENNHKQFAKLLFLLFFTLIFGPGRSEFASIVYRRAKISQYT